MRKVRTAKPLLLTTTPIGIGLGLIEASRVGSWLLALMLVLLSFIGAATWYTVTRIRRERDANDS